MRSVSLVLSLALVMSGCSDTLSPSALAGTWSQVVTTSAFGVVITLTPNGKNLAGTGTSCVDLGGCEAITVTGSVSGDAVHLDLAYGGGYTQRFDGHFASHDLLEGSVIGERAGQPPQLMYPVRYQRVLVL